MLDALKDIERSIREGTFHIPEGTEDIHSAIELELTEKLGPTGKKIHAGRSRNDQVLTDIHLYLKDVCRELAAKTESLFQVLQEKSREYADVLMPGYTHSRPAMPSSFGLWFGAYAELLVDDVHQLAAAWELCNQNPLGSAAGYGNSFPLDREETTRLLGFGTLKYNSIAAQMSRGRTERSIAFAMAMLAGTLNKLAADCCLYSGPDYGFFDFPESLTTGSSIMPHKKNRTYGNSSEPGQIPFKAYRTDNPGLYQPAPRIPQDYQVLKDLLFPAIDTLFSCMEMTLLMIRHLQVNTTLLKEENTIKFYSRTSEQAGTTRCAVQGCLP